MKTKKKVEDEEVRGNSSPVCYVNSRELREEFLDHHPKKPTADPEKAKGNKKN